MLKPSPVPPSSDLLVVLDEPTGAFYTSPVVSVQQLELPGAFSPLLTDGGLVIVDGTLFFAFAMEVISTAGLAINAAYYAWNAPLWQAAQTSVKARRGLGCAL